MSRYSDETDFRHDAQDCTGVLLVNLGTPDKPDAPSVRRYLAEFLWDPRVVEIWRPLWWLILHGVILRIRPRKVAALYRSVWTPEGSPLLVIPQKQTERVAKKLAGIVPGRVETVLAMRYGSPSIQEGLETLRQRGARRLLVLPLYPQYSATTTASVFDEVTRVLGQRRLVPGLRFIQHYHDDPAYINALAASIREHWDVHGRPDKLLMSFHGIPRRCLLAGDPYFCEVQKTGRLLAETLGLEDDQWFLAFQSRFGREEWLKPYVDQTLRDWGAAGVGRVDVVCPGFSADCLETLEEISVQNRETFIESGGSEYHYIPALNERQDHIEALSQLLVRNMAGWDEDCNDPAARLARAQAHGAQA
ncbi:ferrochelatase [Thiogranum longum]|uniref:Ferrochelatase n=1 Tax=Thiogranum longum TaxID=1537524 RepID=A0A4R1HCM4_9GAMM|nr:ferrochelatase [Thiogranum longum]TCK17960.1 ferrochelatase [Thiogranum longum]